jgi:DNA-binding response OmpR family regulator
MAKVLVVEDDAVAAFTVKEYLSQKGHFVDVADNAKDAMAYIDVYHYNVILLDWHLSQNTTGIDFLKEYRGKGGNAPVLMMTSRGTIHDKELGFNSGADDYLQKPFLGQELVLRVEALLRRAPAMPTKVVTIGRLKLDMSKRVIYVDEKELQLRPMEFALLEHFIRHPGFVFSSDQLVNAVWPSNSNPTDSAVRFTIKRLRERVVEALGDDPIETVHGMGYKLNAEKLSPGA